MQPTCQSIDLPSLDQVIERSVLTVGSDTSVTSAIALLNQSQADCILVVEDLQLLGVFTERDVVRLTASGIKLSRLKLAEVMTRQVVTLTRSSSQDIFTALSLMRQHQIRHLPIVDKHGQLLGLVTQSRLMQVFTSMAIDNGAITLQQQVEARTTELEQEISESQQTGEAKFQAVFNSTLDAIAIADDNGRFIEVNLSACELFGLSKVELLGCTIADFIEPGLDFNEIWHFREQKNLAGEFRLHLHNGVVREVEYAATADFIPHHHLSIIRDISERQAALRERKQAKKTLQESTEKYRRIIETTIEGVWLIDAQGKTTFVNSQMAEMLGYTVDEMLSMPLSAFIDEEGQEIATKYLDRRRQGIPERHDFKFQRQDGSDIWTSLSTSPIFNDSGEYAGALAMVTDISERKQAEEQLRISEEQLRLALDFSQIGIWDLNPTTGKVICNDNVKRLLGLVPGAVESSYQTWRDRVHTEDIERVEQAISHALATHTYYETEYRIIQPNGSLHYLAARGRGIYNESGKAVRMVGVLFDVSKNRQAEAALRDSEQRYVTLTQAVPVGIFRTDPEGHCLYVNERWSQITGLSLQEAWQDGWTQALHPDDRERIFSEWYECAQHNLPFQSEYRFRRADGVITWVFGQAVAERGSDDELIGYVGTITDISDSKRKEEALRQYERIVSATPDGVALVNCDYTYRLVNQTYLLLHQKCREEIVGHSISELLGEDVFTHTIKPLLDRSLTGETIQYEAWFNYAIASHRFVSVTYAPYIEMDGTISGVVVNTRDLTELKQAEEKIREQATLLNVATDAILVRNLDNQILFWNKGAERLFGWSGEEALGKNASELLYNEITPQLQSALKTVFERGSWQGELRKVDKFGKEIIVASSWTLVQDEAGKPKSILTVDTDITEKKKIEAQFLRAQRLESIGTLAGGIAHDLNNILAPILMSVQFLQTKYPEDQNQRILKLLENNVKRGASLVKQVLSFARGLESDRTIIQVRHLILEITQILKETFPKSIELYIDLASDLWTVSADATQLHQVLMNFCVNARDAMPNGGTLSICANNLLIDQSYARMNIEAKVGAYIVITVADTGTGIPPKIIDRIFDPFFTTKEIGKGTGLGLSTAIGIIKSHDGFVKVDSVLGQGTQFKVYLPASEETVNQPTADPAPLTGHGELILVVDDEAAICDIAKTSLESNNYRVLIANDGIEALAIYAQNKNEISVVLLDMMMPEMDGIVAIRTLQRINPQISIVAMSGLISTEAIAQATGTGVQGFLSKPFTAQELLQTLTGVFLNQQG